jgi:hypothetical protein
VDSQIEDRIVRPGMGLALRVCARFSAPLPQTSNGEDEMKPHGRVTQTARIAQRADAFKSRVLTHAICALGLSLASGLASASLIGAPVYGTLCLNKGLFCQYWDPQETTVDGGVEYEYLPAYYRVAADFSGDQLIVETDVKKFGSNGWLMTFQSPKLMNASVTELSDNFGFGGVSTYLGGDTLRLFWAGSGDTAGIELRAVYQIDTIIPAPASLMLLSLGLIAARLSRGRPLSSVPPPRLES